MNAPDQADVELSIVDGDDRFEKRLAVNGRVIKGARVSSSSRGKYLRLFAFGHGDRAAEVVANLPIDRLAGLFAEVSLPISPPIAEFFGRLTLGWREESTQLPLWEGAGVTFWPTIRLRDWARPYSIAELSEAIREELRVRGGVAEFRAIDRPHTLAGVDFGVAFPFSTEAVTPQAYVNAHCAFLTEVLEASVDQLLRSARRDSLVTFFEFPKSIRTACQQYLIYFVQFLADLGIQADAELKEDAHRILFSVTPRDGAEGLARVQEALQAFLGLPGSAAVKDLVVGAPDIAHHHLASQVAHLEAQLSLARAVDQARSATIESLQLSNYQYRQMLLETAESPRTPECVPLIESAPGEAEREEFLGGTVAVTPYKAKGVEINLPRIIQALRRRFF
jgi:hypothetical protein